MSNDKTTDVRIRLVPFLVRKKCTQCNKGELKPTGAVHLVHPPRYPHACNQSGCDNVENYFEKFPAIEWMDEGLNLVQL